jgi:hypothetical protein
MDYEKIKNLEKKINKLLINPNKNYNELIKIYKILLKEYYMLKNELFNI